MTPEALYHFSDHADIAVFEPRAAPTDRHQRRVVWAVDAAHQQNYLLPRDCPRVTFYPLPDSRPEDIARLMTGSSARHVIAIEAKWVAEVQRQRLYRYTFAPEGFEVLDEGAGYFIAHQSIVPLAVELLPDLLAALTAQDVELRIMPSLWPLREAVIESTLQFSIIRMRNAAPPVGGFVSRYPL